MSILILIKQHISFRIWLYRRRLNELGWRKRLQLTIFTIIVWTFVWNMLGKGNTIYISISNPTVAQAEVAVSTGEDQEEPGVPTQVVQSSPEDIIREIFGEKADEAILIAQCESNLEAHRIGDGHLKLDNGLGESYGIFQIRSGGAEGGGWSRPAKLGITLDEFKTRMLDPRQNIEYAKQIYDRGGWSAWTCGKIKGLI